MTIDVNKLKEELGLGGLEESLKAFTDAQKEKTAKEAREARDAAETKRMEDLVSKAVGEDRIKLEEALALVKTLDEQSKKSALAFADTVEKQQNTVIELQAEIKALMTAREGRSVLGSNIHKALQGTIEDAEDEIEKLVLLSYVMEKGVFDTAHGADHFKAVNDSSSAVISTESYETVFSNRILRDLQKELVVGALFTELPMSSKLLTMLIEPDAGRATWVDASTYGTDATVGDEVTGQLSEIQFKTFKLAAKSFMTDETEEDAIFSLLPLLRKRLIEAHAVSIEEAFMLGDGVGKPEGLLTMATSDGKAIATDATFDGTVKVTAKTISKLRRGLGRHGLNLAKLVLIVSMDAYYDLLEDEDWQDVAQVGSEASVKLQGQVGRIYGLPVVVSEYFPAKATKKAFAVIVYKDNFTVPRQRQVTVERERQAGKQRDAYYVTQRVNLQRFFKNGIVAGTYA